MAPIILGLDIGGTKTAVVRGNRAGQTFDRRMFPTAPGNGFAAFLDALAKHIETCLLEGPAPEAISVSVGGPLDIERGVLLAVPNLAPWENVPLKQALEQRFQLPVYVEHDGNAGALAEFYFGAARGFQNVIFLTLGTGCGSGLILNGRLYRGTCDLAGEIGHIRLADDGPEGFGKTGSWEGFCGGAGIAKLAALRFPVRWRDGSTSAREIGELALQGDQDARAVIQETGYHLGRGLSILLDVLNPEMIVLGALAVRLGELILAPAREVMQREALPGAVAACQLQPAALGERIGDVAALCAAIQALGGPQQTD